MILQDPVSKHMTKDPVCIQQTGELSEAVTLINKHNIRHLPVLEGERLVGLVSERDLGLIESLLPEDWEAISVAEAMTPSPFSVLGETKIGEVAKRMAIERIGSAVIIDDNHRVVGIFTTVDAMRVLALAAGLTFD